MVANPHPSPEVSMLTVAQALDRIKGQLTAQVPEELIRQLCDEVGHRWRDRHLGPVVTTYLFLEQILHGNLAVGELRRRAHLSFTDAGYCHGAEKGTCKISLGRKKGHARFLLTG